mmetsp:Transcript_34594/g.46729  ORF Transcript_34594/g.46729 Transcript_34594/m.46729 type:complete len:361 (-) Transcript_34594:493-1575(-)|eukprot:CAMPEP_0185744300 /NCGR_PEP_ID=MMETSP1174-20130828/2314_1 /TAXON_ID=35687 /ORGANISM="Dictyocha speculum, Strain CCMP1381" /LENGTH=360 /DNA_ID=CAMNT_0028417573 /DNA_START=89 /DNA_END=1171 /DNA_ORIENTATION=+
MKQVKRRVSGLRGFKNSSSSHEAQDKSIPAQYPIFVEIYDADANEGHPMYGVLVKVPSLQLEWRLSYRFAHFRELQQAIEDQIEPGILVSSFPKTLRRRSLGIPLTADQMRDRVILLDEWLQELLYKRTQLPRLIQQVLNEFVGLHNLGDHIDEVVFQRPAARQVVEDFNNCSSLAQGGKATADLLCRPLHDLIVANLLTMGIPMLQHKHRKSKLGTLTSRPCLLRSHFSLDILDLVVPNDSKDGSGWSVSKQIDVTDITSVSVGGASSAMMMTSLSKKGGEYMAQADVRCFSIIAGPVQWDLELPPSSCPSDVGTGSSAEAETISSLNSNQEDLLPLTPELLRDSIVKFLTQRMAGVGE